MGDSRFQWVIIDFAQVNEVKLQMLSV